MTLKIYKSTTKKSIIFYILQAIFGQSLQSSFPLCPRPPSSGQGRLDRIIDLRLMASNCNIDDALNLCLVKIKKLDFYISLLQISLIISAVGDAYAAPVLHMQCQAYF